MAASGLRSARGSIDASGSRSARGSIDEGAPKVAPKEDKLPDAKEAADLPEDEKKTPAEDRKTEDSSDSEKQVSPIAANTMKVIVMMLLLLIVCGFGAYFLALKEKDDEPNPDIKYDSDNPDLGTVPHLICVTRVAPAYDSSGDIPYTPCDYLVYYPAVTDFDHQVGFDMRGVKVVAGFNTDAANTTDFGKLSSWVGTKYAILDVAIKDDFSDITAKAKEIQDAFSQIKKSYQKPELVIIGIKIQPKDADATKENGEKLGSISKGSLIIFQTHEPPYGECMIGINELMITKKNYEKLADGINSSVAISTTIGVVKFTAEKKDKTNIGDHCTDWQVLSRSDQTCGSLSFSGDKGVAVKDDAVYVCNTNATAQALFVGPNGESSSTPWKSNIAIFDIELYKPGNDSKCPKLKLEDFYRKGSRKT